MCYSFSSYFELKLVNICHFLCFDFWVFLFSGVNVSQPCLQYMVVDVLMLYAFIKCSKVIVLLGCNFFCSYWLLQGKMER
jgi:hypothetical protein